VSLADAFQIGEEVNHLVVQKDRSSNISTCCVGIALLNKRSNVLMSFREPLLL
jgi:hypothetical protein